VQKSSGYAVRTLVNATVAYWETFVLPLCRSSCHYPQSVVAPGYCLCVFCLLSHTGDHIRSFLAWYSCANWMNESDINQLTTFNPLNAQLNPICHLVALLGAHHIIHVSRTRLKVIWVRVYFSCFNQLMHIFVCVYVYIKQHTLFI